MCLMMVVVITVVSHSITVMIIKATQVPLASCAPQLAIDKTISALSVALVIDRQMDFLLQFSPP